MNDLLVKFQERYYEYDKESIINLNSVANSGEINSVITGLDERCYAVMLLEESPELRYRLFFISATKELQAFGIDFKSEEQDIELLTFAFSRLIVENYPSLDMIDIFNTYQSKVAQMYEMIGILTIADSMNSEKFPKNTAIIAKGVKAIKRIYFIEKLDFYRDFFIAENYILNEHHEKCVYLMLNQTDGQIKIGQSKDPRFREKTLMAQDPAIYILTIWKAPISVELELHKLFKKKRGRGEWFGLNFQDLEKIKKYMYPYQQIECY